MFAFCRSLNLSVLAFRWLFFKTASFFSESVVACRHHTSDFSVVLLSLIFINDILFLITVRCSIVFPVLYRNNSLTHPDCKYVLSYVTTTNDTITSAGFNSILRPFRMFASFMLRFLLLFYYE